MSEFEFREKTWNLRNVQTL